MKKLFLILTLFSTVLFYSCDYLDIVPDDTATLNDAFKNETTAENFIYTCYSYIPQYNNCRTNFSWLMSNETVCSKHWGLQWFSFLQMQQLQYSSSNPVLDIWQRCYQGIKQCYTFQNNIEKVVPVTISPAEYESKKKVWIAETDFLIAYFHSVLLQNYGPVVIVDTEIPLDGEGETYFRPRKPYDECVTAIAGMFDRAIANLPSTVPNNDLGRATKVIAQALKARMYLFAASPLFNGNSDYADFRDKDGNPLINQTYDKNKWKIAMDETKKAITMAEQAGNQLYRYVSSKPLSKFDQAVANQRYTMIDPWNKELIWGYSGVKEVGYDQNCLQTLVTPRGICPRDARDPVGGIGPSLRAVEFFYSKNGIPCNEDPAYHWEDRMKIMPGDSTIYLHRDREPRFYAYVGYDRGPYEVNGDTITLKLRFKEQNGVQQADLNADHLYSGYALKKGVSTSNQATTTGTFTINAYPFPIIRLGELYMNYAEACAEYTGSLDADATRYFNAIREKAGLPTLAESFGTPTGDDLVEIVRRERMNELIFEGHWLYDVKRWKIAEKFFEEDKNGMRGLTSAGTTAEEFYKARVLPERPVIFTRKQYLYPIYQDYIDINPNLIQNPEW